MLPVLNFHKRRWKVYDKMLFNTFLDSWKISCLTQRVILKLLTLVFAKKTSHTEQQQRLSVVHLNTWHQRSVKLLNFRLPFLYTGSSSSEVDPPFCMIMPQPQPIGMLQILNHEYDVNLIGWCGLEISCWNIAFYKNEVRKKMWTWYICLFIARQYCCKSCQKILYTSYT